MLQQSNSFIRNHEITGWLR